MYQKGEDMMDATRSLGFLYYKNTHTQNKIMTLFFATRQATTKKKLKKLEIKLQQRKQGLNEANKYLLQQALEMANNLKMKTFKRW
jgi:hypothetical protein